jgi:hypothetical protein
MRRVILALALACVVAASPGAEPGARQFWFCPGPGTLDYLRLFEHPEEWSRARQFVDVFKFYQQHTQTPAPSIVGPNTYDALVRAKAFATLTKWGKKIALEVGAVKEFYCTPDDSGMTHAVADTLASIRAVKAAGGTVAYLAMDDPFAAGRAPVCGGPALEPTADRIATFVRGVHAEFPAVAIGLIEAYPLASEATLETILELLRVRNVVPAFVHVDVDSRALRPGRDDFTRDMRALRQVSTARNMAFGIIVWGYDGDSDALYTLDAGRVAEEIAEAFPTWNDMPEQVIVQSWAESRTGLRITPTNLPDDAPYTHTRLLWQLFRRFRGQTGAATGTATNPHR